MMKITFELFLQILKEAQVRNKRGIDGNFLKDRNIFFQKIKEDEDKDKLPALSEYNQSKIGPIATHTGCALSSE